MEMKVVVEEEFNTRLHISEIMDFRYKKNTHMLEDSKNVKEIMEIID